MRLFIAEKPDLARAIADALEGRQIRGDGFIKVGDDVITWCFGHLLALKNPDEYDAKYSSWRMADLPMDIQKLALKPIKGKENQVKIIKKLVSEATEIVNAGDPDEEGQLLVDELLEYFKNKKPVGRILINDNTKPLVQKAIANIKDNKDFQGLRNSAYVRSVADWKYGLNLTRAYTLKARESAFNPNVLSVGRVQTPILNLVYERELEVNSHVKENYYNIKGIKEVDFTFKIPKDKLEDKLLKDKDYAEEILKLSQENNLFKVESFEVNKEEIAPTLPYNLLELQADCNRSFKYKPDQVKDITQTLREKHKAITYNRSDCQYLSDEQHDDAPKLIPVIQANLSEYQGEKFDTKIKSKAFNSKNVSAHHAIIPTQTKVDISRLTTEELNVYKVIAQRYLIQFMPNKINERTVISVKNNKTLEFVHNSIKNLSQGWYALMDNSTASMGEEKEEDEILEDELDLSLSDKFKVGEEFPFDELNLIESTTKPKQLYTFATLLKDLTSVAKYIKNPDIKKLLQEKDKDKKGESGGIGTPATRDTIIKLLIDRNFMAEAKSKLTTTQLGKDFLNTLPDNAKKPDMTALWAEKQREIKHNNLSVEEFLNDIDSFVSQEIENIKKMTIKMEIPESMQAKATAYKGSKTDSKAGVGVKKVVRKIDKTYKCAKCTDGYLQPKDGQYGKFWGCSSYPECKTTHKDSNGTPVGIVITTKD